MSVSGIIFGGNTAKTNTAENLTNAAMTSLSSSSAQSAAQKVTCDNTIKLCDLRAKNIVIDGIKQTCNVKVDTKALFDAMQENYSAQKLSSSAVAISQAKSKSFPSNNKAYVDTTINSYTAATTSIRNSIVESCRDDIDEKNNMTICGAVAEDTISIGNLSQQGLANSLLACTGRALQSNTAMQTLDSRIKAESTATATGFDPIADLLGLLTGGVLILVIVVGGLLLAGLVFIGYMFKTSQESITKVFGRTLLVFLGIGAAAFGGFSLYKYYKGGGKEVVDGSGTMVYIYGAKSDEVLKTCTKYDTQDAKDMDLVGAIAAFQTANTDGSGNAVDTYGAFYLDRDAQKLYLVKHADIAYGKELGCDGVTDSYTLQSQCTCGSFAPDKVVDSVDAWDAHNRTDPSLQFTCGVHFAVDASSCATLLSSSTCPWPAYDAVQNMLCDASGNRFDYATCPTKACMDSSSTVVKKSTCSKDGKDVDCSAGEIPKVTTDNSGNVLGTSMNPCPPTYNISGCSDGTTGQAIGMDGTPISNADLPAKNTLMWNTGSKCAQKPQGSLKPGGCLAVPNSWTRVLGIKLGPSDKTKTISKGWLIGGYISLSLGVLMILGGVWLMIRAYGSEPTPPEGAVAPDATATTPATHEGEVEMTAMRSAAPAPHASS